MKLLNDYLFLTLCLTIPNISFGMLSTTRQLTYRTPKRIQTIQRPSTMSNINQPTIWQRMKSATYKRFGWQDSLNKLSLNAPQSRNLDLTTDNQNNTKGIWKTLLSYLYPTQTTPTTAPVSNTTETTTNQIITAQDLTTKSINELKPLFDQFSSLKQIADNLVSLESEAKQQLLRIAAMPDLVRNQLTQQTQELMSYLPSVFSDPLADATHDSTLSPELMKKTEEFLQIAGINPLSVTISYNTTLEKDFFDHAAYKLEGFKVQRDEKGAIISVKAAAILFNKEYINTLSPEILNQKIIHAVTHLAESHIEQAQLLQSILGKTQFDMVTNTPEMRIYQSALERNADLMLGTKNKMTALQTQEILLGGILDYFPTIASFIKETPNASESMIQCDLKDIDASLITQIMNFDTLETVLKKRFLNERSKLIKKYATNQDDFLSFEKAQIDFINKESLQKKHSGAKHDPEIGPALLKLIKQELINANINPDAVALTIFKSRPIETTKSRIKASAKSPLIECNASILSEEDFAKYNQGLPYTYEIDSFNTETPAEISLSEEFIKSTNAKELPYAISLWLIKHEIIHIKYHHSLFLALLLQYNNVQKKGDNWIMNTAENYFFKHKTQPDLKEINNYMKAIELQADILPLAHDRSLAEQTSTFMSGLQGKRSEQYLSYEQLSLFSESINKCWKKEAFRTRRISSMHE